MTRARLQEYSHRQGGSYSGLLSHHAGMALLITESLHTSASVYCQCSPLAKQTLDKLQSCVKCDSPRFIAVLGKRNRYSGQVVGMFSCHSCAVVNPLPDHKVAVLLLMAPLVEQHDLWIRFLIERIEISVVNKTLQSGSGDC